MVIISQERRTIVNFENINFLNIEKAENNKVNILINYADDEEGIIATYKDEQRAKEVLQKIVRQYSSYLELKGGPAIMQGQMDIQPNIFNIPKVYEMPEK